jgi:uncharacterized protein
MREGVLYETLPFLFRLLLVSIGSQATMDVISGYRANVPPEQFGADEAQRFIAYVRAQNPPVPHLSEILAFEEARNAVSRTLEEQIVIFDCNPGVLLNALIERRHPGLLACERFCVEVSINGVQIRNSSPSESAAPLGWGG